MTGYLLWILIRWKLRVGVKQTYMKNFSSTDAIMQVAAEAKTSTWKEGDELKWPSYRKREVGCEEKGGFSKYSWPRL